MKRIFLGFLVLTLCLSIVPAFADSNVTITIDAGDHSPVDVNVNSIDGCNNNAVINDGAGCGTAVKPGKTSTCVVIDGVPSCIEPPDYCGSDPGYCARMARHSCLKNAARDVFGYLEGRLRSIGWWHKGYKFVRSFETRVIYGSRGDNNHYKERRPITFYCKDDPSIKVKAYINVYKKGKDFMTVFTTDFTPAKKCQKGGYVYAEELTLTGICADGYEAVDEFIAYLERLSGGDTDDDLPSTGCDCSAGCK